MEKIVLGATGTPNTSVFEHLKFSLEFPPGALSHLPGQREMISIVFYTTVLTVLDRGAQGGDITRRS